MLATPAAGPIEGAGYGVELRWGGLRALVGFEAATVFCVGTTGQDLLPWFPEVEDLRTSFEPGWVLADVELVCFRGGRPDAAALRRRTSETVCEELRAELPVRCVISDVLRIGNSWLTDVAWEERRDVLTQVFRAGAGGLLSPVFPTHRAALEQGRRIGLTDFFAKRRRGRYFPGEQTREWLLVKGEEPATATRERRRESSPSLRRPTATPMAGDD
jgi:bifunctional non-homologous end joining protein LigD